MSQLYGIFLDPPPVSHFFVVRFPPSGETAKKNVKQVVNLSCPQSFFADGDSHYFPLLYICIYIYMYI